TCALPISEEVGMHAGVARAGKFALCIFLLGLGAGMSGALSAASADDGRVERCPTAFADVVAGSPDERGLACSAVSDALQLLGRCGISPRRPLTLEIMSEVRNRVGTVILGQF